MTPDHAAAFDEALVAKRLPPRHPIDESTWVGKLLATIEPLVHAMREQALREAQPGAHVPEVLGGVVNDGSFNAHAFSHDGRYFVAVNFGALILIHALAQRLFSIPEFFPWVGDPSKEDAARVFSPLSNDAMRYMRGWVEERPSIYALDEDRRRCASLLVTLGTDFLVAHEMGHILGGHLGWMKQRSGRLTMSEAVTTLSKPALALSRQALEMDADGFAMYAVLRRTLYLSDHPPTITSSPRRRVVRTPEDAVRVALLCGMVMMGSFFRPAPPSRWSVLSHPPAGVRVGLNLVAADRCLRAVGRADLRSSTSGSRDWAGRFANEALVSIWPRIGHTHRQDELRLALGVPGQRHLAQILNEWARLAPTVRKYAFGIRPALRTP